MQDIASNLSIRTIIAPEALDGNRTSASIDRKGFESLVFAVSTGDIDGASSFSIKLQDSDETNGGSFTDVEDKWLIGEFGSPLQANAIAKIGYIGHKRYIRAVATKASGTSIVLGVIAILGNAASRPVI